MTSKVITLWLPSAPVSASRPRISKWGSYYSKSYMNYRSETHKYLKSISKKYPIDVKSLFKVELEFICYRPKKPSNPDCPRYDIDNLIKAPLDAITHEKMIWNDDIQILEVTGKKRYTIGDEPHGTKITIMEIK